ncbi:MAG: hypothetical protein AAB624_00390 [Patescibacteria group bacterium]
MNDLTQTVRVVIEITKLDVIKILLPALVSLVVGLLSTPMLLKIMTEFDWRKKKSVSKTIDGRPATLTATIDNEENKVLYRAGGLVVLTGAMFAVVLFRVLPIFFPDSSTLAQLNILSRNQTLIPILMFLGGAVIGFVDDMMIVDRLQWFKKFVGGGLSLKIRIFGVLILAALCSWWLYAKLDISSVIVPFAGTWQMGWWYLPFALLVILGAYGTSNIDGVDGLSGGLNTTAFLAMGTIAVVNTQYDIAALCFAMVGGLLAFLWFNIPPARFMNSETGYVGQILCLATISLFIGVPLLLPIILLPAITAPVTVAVQLLSKKFRGKKVFLAAPVHIHLQLIGWPKYKVTMRYWIFAQVTALGALAIYLTGGYL